MSGGPVFVERIDYEAAVAYLEVHLPEDVRPYADRMATEIIAAALVGVREAESVGAVMSDRRYEVYEVCKHGSVAPHEGWPLHAQVWGDYVTCNGGTRLDSVPDALVEEAAKALYEAQYPGFDPAGLNATQLRALARAALSVLFPGEEEE